MKNLFNQSEVKLAAKINEYLININEGKELNSEQEHFVFEIMEIVKFNPLEEEKLAEPAPVEEITIRKVVLGRNEEWLKIVKRKDSIERSFVLDEDDKGKLEDLIRKAIIL